MAEPIKAVFRFERDTKRTRRYAEEAEEGEEVVGTLYVKQAALRKAFVVLPEKIKVTIQIEEA